MKIKDLLVEYGSSNPFIGIVTNIDTQIREVEVAIHAGSSKIFSTSLKSQIDNLLKFLESGTKWIVPEPKLRAELHAALPEIIKHVKEALSSLDDVNRAKEHLMSARKITVKRSHLTFGTIE